VIVPAVTVNVAALAPDPTVTEAGVINELLLSDRLTPVADVAALLKLTVQVLDAPDPSVAGVHESEVSVAAAARLMPAVFDVPLYVAVTVAT
jgi:hypothetical protein